MYAFRDLLSHHQHQIYDWREKYMNIDIKYKKEQLYAHNYE